MPAAGPQKLGKGNSPRSALIDSRRFIGWVWMSNDFLPSARYSGRGVMEMSASVAMLYHQNKLAQVNPGISRCS